MNDTPNMEAFYGAGCLATLAAFATVFVVFAVSASIALSAGLAVAVFLLSFLYLFGAGIGEW